MRKLVLYLLMGIAMVSGMVVPARPALAAYRWCTQDPIIHLPNGALIHVTTAVPWDYVPEATVNLTISAPIGSEMTGVSTGPFTVNVNFSATRTDGQVVVTGEPQGDYPIRVHIKQQGRSLAWAEGAPGEAVTVSALP